MSDEKIIEIRNLTRVYGDGVEIKALDGVNMDIEPGEFLAIVGPSGSGKSTLLHQIGILDTPTSGTILLHGVDITKMSDRERSRMRNQELGFIFQYHHLLPDFNALENVMMPLLIRGVKPSRARKIAREMLDEVGLADREDHRPNQLSGGQNQRVAIARALANDPPIILADEPTGNVDTKSGNRIMGILEDINNKGETVITVTHDPNVAKRAKRILEIQDGVVSEENV